MTEIRELLRAYTQEGCEQAFEALVARNVDLVYATALRRVNGDVHKAQDVAQIVFTDLARKARSLPPDVRLSGWLHRHTCFVASTLCRSEQRRLNREKIALEMQSNSSDDAWTQLAPVVDEAIEQLEIADRDAIVLRFFEGCDLRAVGVALGINEDTAQKRVSRALDKLRILLVQQGVVLSATALIALLTTQVLAVAPLGMAAGLATAALKATTPGGTVGVIPNLLAVGKIKFALGTVAVALMFLAFFWAQHAQINPAGPPVANATPTNTPSFSVNASMQDVANTGTQFVETIPTEVLNLAFVALESGKPIPNVQVEYWGWADQKFTRKNLMSNRLGDCNIEIPQNTTKLELFIRSEGFADSCLSWQPERGSKVPDRYTVKMARPVLIGGYVVDPEGQAVAEARVGFGFLEDLQLEANPESHEFREVEVFTDAEGRWRLNRIAPDMIPRLRVVASHPLFTQSQRIILANDSTPLQQLRDGTYVFHLAPAVTVEGHVVDTQGQPVSDAQILVGLLDETGSRKGTTAFDGAFRVMGCRPGKTLLSVQANGYALLTLTIQATTNAAPFILALKPRNALPLRLRIVDQAGSAISNALIRLNTLPRPSMTMKETGPPPVQAKVNTTVDAEGRWVWDSAPDQELEFDLAAPGYCRVNRYKVVPDGKEHTIVLAAALAVSGTVCNAAGQSIPKFRIICGWPETNSLDGVVTPRWSAEDRYWMNYTGGQYWHTFVEAINGNNSHPSYMLKFEAEGYAPFISRPILGSEGKVQLDVKLSTATMIQVVLPDGSAASDIPVVFVSKGSQLLFSPEGLVKQGSQEKFYSIKTDAQGCFRHPEDPSIQRVMVVHADGFADLTPDVLSSTRTMHLEKWARLEGTYYTTGKPAVGRVVYFQLGQGDFSTVISHPRTFVQEVDDQGRFVFPKVPPGKNILVWLEPIPGTQGASHSTRTLTEVETRAGETAFVTCTNDFGLK